MNTMMIRGEIYTQKQIEAAIDAAWLLSLAYAAASEDNGGNSVVDVEKLNQANNLAAGAFDDQELTNHARAENGLEPVNQIDPNEEDLPAYEFKRPDDTEGGTPD